MVHNPLLELATSNLKCNTCFVQIALDLHDACGSPGPAAPGPAEKVQALRIARSV
jgi:hypothetical protein